MCKQEVPSFSEKVNNGDKTCTTVFGWVGPWWPKYFEHEKWKKKVISRISPGINKIQPTKYVHRRGVAAFGVFVSVRHARILFMSCTLSLLISPIFVRSVGQNGEAQHVHTRTSFKGHLMCHTGSTLSLRRSIRFFLLHLCTSDYDAGI